MTSHYTSDTPLGRALQPCEDGQASWQLVSYHPTEERARKAEKRAIRKAEKKGYRLLNKALVSKSLDELTREEAVEYLRMKEGE